MASLHRPGDPKPVLAKPSQTFARYLGKSVDGEAEWEILGETYTGTCITYSPFGQPGAPSVNMLYPASSARPDSSSNWAIRVDPTTNAKVRPLTPGAVPVPIFYNWSYEFANSMRSNSWTEFSIFDLTTAEESTDTPSDSATLVRNERAPVDGYPYTFESGGTTYGNGPHTYVRPAPFSTIETDTLSELDDDFEPTSQLNLEDILADAEITYEFYGVPSLCRIGGWAYLEVATYSPDPESEGSYIESIYVAKFNVARLDFDDPPALIYIRLLYLTTE